MRTRATVLFVVSCVAAIHVAASQDRGQPELAVRVHGDTELREGWPLQARAIIERVFRDAGMRVLWISCVGTPKRSLCARPPAPNEAVVRVRAQRDDPQTQGCGRSIRPKAGFGHYVTIFNDCVSAASERLGISEAVLGAHVMAHEIGHLLLPLGHARRGLMRADLDRSDWALAVKGELRFSQVEGRQMLEALQLRVLAADAGTAR